MLYYMNKIDYTVNNQYHTYSEFYITHPEEFRRVRKDETVICYDKFYSMSGDSDIIFSESVIDSTVGLNEYQRDNNHIGFRYT